MSRQSNQRLKILYLLDILRRYSDEEHPLNAVDILKLLEQNGIYAERKAIYSDIAALEQYGCDIVKTSIPKKGWFLGEREFEEPEIFLLRDAVRSAKFITASKTRELISRLNSGLSIYRAGRLENSVYFSPEGKAANEELYYSIDKLNRAIIERKQVRLKYFSRYFDSQRRVCRKEKEMTVSPYALTWQDDHYYLICNHIKYDNLMHLRLDRIGRAEILPQASRHFSEVCEYKELFDTADYTSKLFGMYSGQLYDIELCCNKSITEQVLDRFSESLFIKKVTEDSFNITVKTALSEALVTWIMNYGDRLRVVKPDTLREMVTERARNILKIYGDDKL